MLRLTEIVKRFDQPAGKPLEVLRGLSLCVSPQEVVAIMGPNGCGKTTLLNVIAGDLEPDSGDIELDGRSLLHISPYRRARMIGRVHQESYKALAAELTVGEVLAIASKRKQHLSLGFPDSRDVVTALGRLSGTTRDFVSERIHCRADALSGGQRQLLALAVAILGTPRVLLLDEHRASLDEQYKGVADELLRQYLHANASLVLVATHDHEWTRRECSRIETFVDGKIETIRT